MNFLLVVLSSLLSISLAGRNLQDPASTASYPVESGAEDRGADTMQKLKDIKIGEAWYVQQCRASGACPEFASRPTQGPAPCVNGFADAYPCSNVDLLSVVSIADLGYSQPLPFDFFREGNDIWGWVDPENGDEYAIVGLTGGTSFVRVTNGDAPEVLGFLYNRQGSLPLIWRDIKIHQNTAYIGADTGSHGIQVVDLTRFRGKTAADFEYIEADFNYDGIGASHNLDLNADTNTLYAVGGSRNPPCRAGLHMIDISNRLQPEFIGCFADDGYVHDSQCVIYHGPDTRYQGREICFCYNENTFTIVDISTKPDGIILSRTGYAGAAYVHQGWLTDDHAIAISDDELDEVNGGAQARTLTYVWDIQNLNNPILRTVYESSETSPDHNLYIVGDLVFQANYEAGLRILRLNPQDYTLTELGYFDVLPSQTTVNFRGAWSNYPYFPSGNVIVSSIDYGLFVVKPDYDAIGA